MSDHTYDPQPPADRTLKIPHLVFGLLFLGFAGLWVLGESGAVKGEYVATLGPAVLILAGLVGLVASVASSRNRRHRERRHAVERPAENAVETATNDPAEYPADYETTTSFPRYDDEPTTRLEQD
jgi:hypothetical protein